MPRSRSIPRRLRSPIIAALALEFVACRAIIGYEDGSTASSPSSSKDANDDDRLTDASLNPADNNAPATDAPAEAASIVDGGDRVDSGDGSTTDLACAPIDPDGGSRTTPSCPTTTGCGAGNENCCASMLVPGGTFDRSNDPAFPATVRAFRLDVFEVTVARFRKFFESYAPDNISACAGRNPNNPADHGWDPSWSALLPSRDVLDQSLRCNPGYFTWTSDPGPNENRPITCLTWYEAMAFCIWDNGRLPTDAEWSYAAVGGGEEQLIFPWGNDFPLGDTKKAIYACLFPTGAGFPCIGVQNMAPVGSAPLGNGRWGQADMGGNAAEWVRDTNAAPPRPCVDCASLAPNSDRIIRGGAFWSGRGLLQNNNSSHAAASDRQSDVGVRCARNE